MPVVRRGVGQGGGDVALGAGGSLGVDRERLELLYRVGVALSAERDRDRLVEMILLEAKGLCGADGGTLYLMADGAGGGETLRFEIVRTDSLGLRLGGSGGAPVDLPEIPLRDPVTGAPNRANVASCAALDKVSYNIEDAYAVTGFDFAGTRTFDERNGYRTRSVLTIPLVNGEGAVLGVLQLLNAHAGEGEARASGPIEGGGVAFTPSEQRVVEALASQAAVALDNRQLIEDQRRLLESFIRVLAAAIDAKSHYTGAHCERVPVLALELARAAAASQEPALASFQPGEDDWYELRTAAWLHDCGKVTTPAHIMDKATKLEGIHEGLDLVRARFEVKMREVELDALRRQVAGEATDEAATRTELDALRADLEFLADVNVGREFLDDAARARIARIATRRVRMGGEDVPLLTEAEREALSVSRGTLTEAERLTINGHMVETIRMLEALPFPRHLRRVPEYAGGHHERMDGTGYPRGIFAGDMSIPARILAIADVFEALTAGDRPYKRGKRLSEAMRIMGEMKRNNHLDPELFDLFVRSGVYRRYGEQYLRPELVDDVDEEALLAIEPRPFPLPPKDVRDARWRTFLPAYQEQAARHTLPEDLLEP